MCVYWKRSCRVSNRASLENKSTVLPLYQAVLYYSLLWDTGARALFGAKRLHRADIRNKYSYTSTLALRLLRQVMGWSLPLPWKQNAFSFPMPLQNPTHVPLCSTNKSCKQLMPKCMSVCTRCDQCESSTDNKEFCVLHIQSNTPIFYLVIQ